MNKPKPRNRYYRYVGTDGTISLMDGYDTDAGAVLAVEHLNKATGKKFEEISYEEFLKLQGIMHQKYDKVGVEYINKAEMGIIDA